MTVVSACLLGHCCKYSGGHNKNDAVITYVNGKDYLPICPETLGGLGSPRAPAEIQGGDGGGVLRGEAQVIDKNGRDITEQFIPGAKKVLELCAAKGVTEAILKERSPSCGVREIYDGSFTGKLTNGRGICAAMLAEAGIKLYSEHDFE